MATAVWVEDDEWELMNDDGFVYKRKKRPRHSPAAAAPQPADPAAEENRRRQRKIRALLKLKETHSNEIRQWELLSNTFNALHLQTLNQQQQQQQQQQQHLLEQFEVTPALSSDSAGRKLFDDLLALVEAQEAVITNVSKLCDAAEALCNAQEERSKQAFMDLPIWDSSPLGLINALCE